MRISVFELLQCTKSGVLVFVLWELSMAKMWGACLWDLVMGRRKAQMLVFFWVKFGHAHNQKLPGMCWWNLTMARRRELKDCHVCFGSR